MYRGQGRGQSQIGRGGTSGGRGGTNGGRGGGRGGGHGGWLTEENKAEISAKRTTSIQIGSEATDDLLVAPKLDSNIQHIARFILSKREFDGFRSQKQAREFVHSLLVNLSNHHSVDTSGLLTDLASDHGRARLREIATRRMYIDAGQEKDLFSFQYVVMPLVGVLTRENVCQSTLVQHSGRIYAEVYTHRTEFLDQGIIRCMRELMNRGSMNDTSFYGDHLSQDQSLMQIPSFQHAMLAIVRLVYHLIKRVQGAKQEMVDTVASIRDLATDCIKRFVESAESKFYSHYLEKECQRLYSMISDLSPDITAPVNNSVLRQYAQEPSMVHLIMNFDPPGSLSKNGCRHDNDHASIRDIKVVPTHDELTCKRLPFLPSNDVPGAPHHLLPGWPQLLDIHFRLNREDMIDQLRRGIMYFLEALRKVPLDQQASLLNRKELRRLVGQDVSLNAYGNIQFLGTNIERKMQGSIKIAFDQPSQLKGQSTGQRKTFWERSKRRLMHGSLVCFIFPTEEGENGVRPAGTTRDGHTIHLCLGVVSAREASELAKDDKQAALNITLTDQNDLRRFVAASTKGKKDVFMVESMGGFFEAYRPILRALQTCEPGEMPFGKYFAPAEGHQASAAVAVVDPPLYATAPNFEFDLTVLLRRPVTCRLDVQDPVSRQQAVRALRTHSMLDDTQSLALVDALSREVALISGPPGTGKTKIGVDLMRVLLENAERMNCGPIICICFTNHALDQFLEHLLDQGVTHLVRIGSRSQSTRLHPYALTDLMKSQNKDYAVRAALGKAYTQWEVATARLKRVETEARRQVPLTADILSLIRMENDIQHYDLEQAGDETVDKSYTRWLNGDDIAKMKRENRNIRKKWEKEDTKGSKKGSKKGSNQPDSLLDVAAARPKLHNIPNTNRPLAILRDADLWKMSMQERTRLNEYWIGQLQDQVFNHHAEVMDQIQNFSKQVDDAYDEMKRCILRKAQVIGMTTNGAAKFQSIIQALSPKIIICEEAGEVLESHILAAISGSTQHLILIGDHLQLRPQIATYELSSDSKQGKNHNLDRSLFERLVTTAKVPSSLLTTQRRMRPEICNLVRHTLYPQLIDGEKVLEYPDVYGMASNLFFMDHHHPEDSRDQYGIQSYANTFEAQMVHGLVRHLIKNGYHQSDIAVLTPYLGQLSRLKDRLSDIFQLAIDERDQELLDTLDDNDPTTDGPAKDLPASRSLTLRTIDNYQGEEADIIIISLVRSNTREDQGGSSSTIGFLKSPNRTNVLLSRARHGMYLIGNAALMDQPKKNGIWHDIMADLYKTNGVGDGFPLRCRNHPDTESVVTTPDDFTIHAPNGGCTRACDQVLTCGHICTMLCHWDDRDHRKFKCIQKCPRLHPQCNHVCPKQCSQDCGDCAVPVGPLDLSCGHVLAMARCFQIRDPSRIRCKEPVARHLLHCEHEHTMDCCKDRHTYKCTSTCNVVLACGHTCTRQCHLCQATSLAARGLEGNPPQGKINRTSHGTCQQKCGKMLHCGHICSSDCHFGGDCPPCKKNCAFTCSHAKCRHMCSTLCSACCEPCPWTCIHQGRCKLPCGAPCSRLPCNQRCVKTLSCGHQCPSVCGEICPPKKFCVECKSDPSIMEMVVDLIMQAPLSDVDVCEDPILVPSCGHALTMSTLDSLMEMNNYYKGDADPNTGTVSFVQTKTLPNHEVPIVGCPSCRAPISGLMRYGRRIRHSQLVMRLKKFEISQDADAISAETNFTVAQAEIEKATPSFLKKLLTPSPTSSKSSSDKKKDLPRPLGKVPKGSMFPNSDVRTLVHSYGILSKNEMAWKELIKPALEVLKAFDKIREKAAVSPGRRLYEASVAHLYRFKSEVFYVDSAENGSTTVQWQQGQTEQMMAECARECGLSPDGQSGSSLVRSIQGRFNVMQVILHAAQQVLEHKSSGGINSGWYLFVEDLIQCCLAHARIQRDTASKGNYPRIETYANMSLLDVYYRQMQWIGLRPFDNTDQVQLQTRQKAADAVLGPFMDTLRWIKINENIGLRNECLPKARDYESRMVTAYKIALQQIQSPLTKDEKLQVFRAIQAKLGGSGHWYQCPNGHSYVIGECGGAMQESVCPECGASIGGRSHSLRSDNRRDQEFESMYRQGR